MSSPRPPDSWNPLSSFSIRARLLSVYVGILLIGFAVLTLVAGGEIAESARRDYQERLLNEVRLIARGISPYFENYNADDPIPAAVAPILLEFETQTQGEIAVFMADDDRRGLGNRLNSNFRGMPEVETALRNQIVVVERNTASGVLAFHTASPIQNHRGPDPIPIVQLSVPAANLQTLIFQRWLRLWSIFVGVLSVAVVATLLISRSIIRPLYALRESAVKLAQGEFSHRVTAVSRDEIGAVALAFNEMADQVQEMLEEQRAFASNTSHELRTPLTTIRLRSEALRYDETLDDATAKQYVTEIDDEVRHLGKLVEDLTLLSRFDAGRAELGGSEIDITRFAQSLKGQWQSIATQKGIQLDVAVPETPFTVNASLNHLTVVFRNLLDNAVKYTPSGGHIRWAIQLEPNGFRSVIEDSGQGIAAEHLPHLFERFYRADKARSRHIPGTGLGLALVKSIVESYGGAVNVQSAGIQQGTTVTVFWPAPTAQTE